MIDKTRKSETLFVKKWNPNMFKKIISALKKLEWEEPKQLKKTKKYGLQAFNIKVVNKLDANK